MKNLNGIVLDGKFYESIPSTQSGECSRCSLYKEAECICPDWAVCRHTTFRFSQSLTDRLNRQ